MSLDPLDKQTPNPSAQQTYEHLKAAPEDRTEDGEYIPQDDGKN